MGKLGPDLKLCGKVCIDKQTTILFLQNVNIVSVLFCMIVSHSLCATVVWVEPAAIRCLINVLHLAVSLPYTEWSPHLVILLPPRNSIDA